MSSPLQLGSITAGFGKWVFFCATLLPSGIYFSGWYLSSHFVLSALRERRGSKKYADYSRGSDFYSESGLLVERPIRVGMAKDPIKREINFRRLQSRYTALVAGGRILKFARRYVPDWLESLLAAPMSPSALRGFAVRRYPGAALLTSLRVWGSKFFGPTRLPFTNLSSNKYASNFFAQNRGSAFLAVYSALGVCLYSLWREWYHRSPQAAQSRAAALEAEYIQAFGSWLSSKSS